MTQNTSQETLDKIKSLVLESDVFLFMKGTKDFPMCGFSAQVSGILNYYQVDYQDFNVLEDQDVRQGVKVFSNWPTIPQLYIKGEFIGGCDILMEMVQKGEFEELLNEKSIKFTAPEGK